MNLTLNETIRALINGVHLPNEHIINILTELQDNGAEQLDELKAKIEELEEELWLIEDDEKTEQLLESLQNEHDANYCTKYGENGYNDPKKGVILANWNNIDQKIQDYFEVIGYELEWSDEWITDSEHDKCYRTSGNSYNWQPMTRYTDSGELLTPDSHLSDWLEYASATEEETSIKCLPSFIDIEQLESLGYIKFNENSFESGWHEGQTDDPEKVLKLIYSSIDNVESVIFQLDKNSQFYSEFSVFYKLTELNEDEE